MGKFEERYIIEFQNFINEFYYDIFDKVLNGKLLAG